MFFKIYQLLIDYLILLIFFPVYSILILIISIVLLFSNHGNVFFVQKRVGLNLKVFKLYKFISMSSNLNINEEQRITNFGKFLRRSSLDELPQIFNILKRDMSFVGPRPLPADIILSEKYFSLAKKRCSVLPGLTGYAQVRYVGIKRSLIEKIKLDIEYVDKKTWFLFIKIIIMTFKVIFVRFIFNKKGKTL